MQVRHTVAEHRRVHMLGTSYVAQRPAGPGAPPSHVLRLRVGEVGHPRRVPQWLHEQVPQVRPIAFASQYLGRSDMGHHHQLVFGNWPAWH